MNRGFVADALFDGHKIRCLTIVDHYSRKCMAILFSQDPENPRIIRIWNPSMGASGMRVGIPFSVLMWSSQSLLKSMEFLGLNSVRSRVISILLNCLLEKECLIRDSKCRLWFKCPLLTPKIKGVKVYLLSFNYSKCLNKR